MNHDCIMRRAITPIEADWLATNQKWRCVSNDKLKNYGVIHYYHLPYNIENSPFYGNFILIFADNTLEDWCVPDIKALLALIS